MKFITTEVTLHYRSLLSVIDFFISESAKLCSWIQPVGYRQMTGAPRFA